LRRWFDEALSQAKSLSASLEVAEEDESLAHAQLAWRLQRLNHVTAPERLRRRGLAYALNANPSWRLERLHHVAAPDRLRRTALAHAMAGRPHVVPLVPQRSQLLAVSQRLAATAAAVFLLAYGTFAASAASLPDSPLYSVKLLVDDARVAVAPAEDKPLIYAEQASRRLDETDALISDGRIDAAERAASDAAKRIESARAAAERAPAPQARDAIASTTAQYRSVSESLASRGGSSPAVTGAQPSRVASASAPPPVLPPAPEPNVPADDDEPNGDAVPAVQAVSVPGGNAVFDPIPTSPQDAPSNPTPAAIARVNAPSSNDFVGIDPAPGGRVAAPASTAVIAIDADALTPRATGSSTATQTGTSIPRPSVTRTPTPRSATVTATPTRPATKPTNTSLSPTPGAPQIGFTPIPDGNADPSSRDPSQPGRSGSAIGRTG